VRIKAFAAVTWLLLLGPFPAGGQVHAPSLVEGELPAEEPKATNPKGVEPLPPAATAVPATTPIPPGATSGVSITADDLRRLQRPLEPVRIPASRIDEIGRARRKALQEQDGPAAREASRALRDAMRALGIASLPWHAVAEVRESERSLKVNAVDEAIEHALLATELASDLPEPWFALARARLAADPTRPGPALGAAWVGFRAAYRDPHVARALLGDLAVAGLAALFGAAALTIGLLFLSRLRLFLHDFEHLPIVRSGTPWQGTVVALALLALPVVLRLGPFAILCTAALAAWAYLSRPERLTVTVALLALLAMPWLAGEAARATAWQGTLADPVHEMEVGWPTPEFVAALKVRGERERLPSMALLAIGRWHKRQGDLAEARRWYEAALVADPRSAAAQVDLGNVLFLQDDLAGARTAYLAAIERGGDLSTVAAAQYDLSKLYLRLAAVGQSSEARRKAQMADPAYLARYGSDDDFRANAWLVDALPPMEALAALAERDPAHREVGEAVLHRVAGPLARWGWPWLPLGMIGSLWLLGLLFQRLSPAAACDRCGRPACRRCDPGAGTNCGQCVNVYLRPDAVDGRDRTRKEAQVRRHAWIRRWTERVLAVLGGGAGNVVGGRPISGFVVLLLLLFLGTLAFAWHGIVPMPLPSPFAAGLRLALAVPLFLVVYAIAVRDAFRRTRPE